MICPPVAVEPVNATLSMPGCLTRCAPIVGPGRDDVDHAGREADLGRELREPQRRQRRRVVGLEDDRAAGGERRRELPRRHHQRVVPRHDLSGDADGLLQGVEEERAADGVRAARDRRDRRTRRSGSSRRPDASSAFTDEIALPTLRDSSSASSLRSATIASASACRSRERSVGGVFSQSPSRAPRAASNGAVDVFGRRDGGTCERLARRRLDQLAGLGALRELAADPEAVSRPRRQRPWRVADSERGGSVAANPADHIDVHAARIPDRDRLLKELREAGSIARPRRARSTIEVHVSG